MKLARDLFGAGHAYLQPHSGLAPLVPRERHRFLQPQRAHPLPHRLHQLPVPHQHQPRSRVPLAAASRRPLPAEPVPPRGLERRHRPHQRARPSVPASPQGLRDPPRAGTWVHQRRQDSHPFSHQPRDHRRRGHRVRIRFRHPRPPMISARAPSGSTPLLAASPPRHQMIMREVRVHHVDLGAADSRTSFTIASGPDFTDSSSPPSSSSPSSCSCGNASSSDGDRAALAVDGHLTSCPSSRCAEASSATGSAGPLNTGLASR